MNHATVLCLGGMHTPVYKRDCLNTILYGTDMYGHTYWVVWTICDHTQDVPHDHASAALARLITYDLCLSYSIMPWYCCHRCSHVRHVASSCCSRDNTAIWWPGYAYDS